MTSKTDIDPPKAVAHAAEIVREYGPFAGTDHVHGVTHDGHRVWAATGDRLIAFDPDSGEPTHALACACDAGTAFDGTYRDPDLADSVMHPISGRAADWCVETRFR